MNVDTAPPAVSDAMLRFPKTTPAGASAGAVRRVLDDDHVHAVLLVEGSRLVAVCERSDLGPGVADDTPARDLGRLHHRVVPPDTPLEPTRVLMLRHGHRRLAVVDAHGRLLGLLCLNRSGLGFCSDTDVAARAADRADDRGDDPCRTRRRPRDR